MLQCCFKAFSTVEQIKWINTEYLLARFKYIEFKQYWNQPIKYPFINSRFFKPQNSQTKCKAHPLSVYLYVLCCLSFPSFLSWRSALLHCLSLMSLPTMMLYPVCSVPLQCDVLPICPVCPLCLSLPESSTCLLGERTIKLQYITGHNITSSQFRCLLTFFFFSVFKQSPTDVGLSQTYWYLSILAYVLSDRTYNTENNVWGDLKMVS